jgi:hypothetical protein
VIHKRSVNCTARFTQHDINDVNDHLPEVIRQLLTPMELRRYDATSYVVVPTTTYNEQERTNSDRTNSHRQQTSSCQGKNAFMKTTVARGYLGMSRTFHCPTSEANLFSILTLPLQKNEVRWPGTQIVSTHQTCETC